MNRIKELFATDSKKLIVFITAGFPNKDSTKNLVLEGHIWVFGIYRIFHAIYQANLQSYMFPPPNLRHQDHR